MNEGAMKHLLSDKFTLGGDASVAAGPIGRSANAQDRRGNAGGDPVVFPFARPVRRHFVVRRELRPDGDANRELYGHEATNREILTDDFKTPAAARNFEKVLHRDSAHRDP
jgi:lipid-binding SYLF domain-containing protein